MASLASGGMESGSRVASCAGCRLADHCSGDPSQARGPFQGASLILASLLYFLLPALLALLGAALFEGAALRQLAGGAGGLLLGMLIANLAARRQRAFRVREECFEPR